MRVTLIKPRIGQKGISRYVDSGRMEPLSIGIVAALFPLDFELDFYDDRCEDIDYTKKTDYVFITVETFTAKRSYEIAALYKKQGAKVIMGGMHPTLIPGEVGQYADSVFTGDAEQNFTQVIEDMKKGQLKPLYQASFGTPQKDIFPRRDIYKGKNYLPVSLLQLGRGCSHQCEFCATGSYFKNHYYMRDMDSVLEEIKRDCGKILFFVDDNFTADINYVKEFLRKLIPFKRLWVTQITIDCVLDTELLDLMRRSGCLGFVIGFESIVKENLDLMNKRHNLANFNYYKKYLENLKKYKLNIWAAFTLGHDFDTRESIIQTLSYAKDNSFAFAAFNILTPYPNTPFYNRLNMENRLLFDGRWWLHPDYRFNHAVFKPANLSPEELTRLGWILRKKFNNAATILKRLLHYRSGAANLWMALFYLNFSMVFRKEIYSKQSLGLGIEKKSEVVPL